jgi:hypothetical protein
VLEMLFVFVPADKLDSLLLTKMRGIWKDRYPEFDESTRESIFRSTKNESRAYVGNFQEKVLALYALRLKEFGIDD